MSEVVERSKAAGLYEHDFAAWVQEQARLLRERRFEELDLDRLIEEVTDLGKAERNAVLSRARQIVAHFLKLQYSPASWPRRGWKETIRTQRMDLEEILSPTLRRELLANLDAVYARAKQSAARDLLEDRVDEEVLPDTCPFSIEQILDPDWFPASIHGMQENLGNPEQG